MGKIWIWSAMGVSEEEKEKVRESVKEEESSIDVMKCDSVVGEGEV